MNEFISSLISSSAPLVLLLVAGICDRLGWRWLVMAIVAVLGVSELSIGFLGFASGVAASGGQAVIGIDSLIYILAGISALALLRTSWRLKIKNFVMARAGRDSLLDMAALLLLLQALIIYVLPLALQQLPGFAPTPGEGQTSSGGLVGLLLNSALFILAAAILVNAGFGRSLRQMLERLGWTRLSVGDVSWGLGVGLLAFAVSILLAMLGTIIDPGGAEVARDYTGQISTAAGSMIGLALAVALAGFAEETLFRGAIQPRLGLMRTAALFAVLHVGYGLFSFAALGLFMVGVLMGLLRQRRGNTLAPAVAHAAYNLLIVLGMML